LEWQAWQGLGQRFAKKVGQTLEDDLLSAISIKSSLARLASPRNSKCSQTASNRWRSERLRERTKELKTKSSRERGPVHCWLCEVCVSQERRLVCVSYSRDKQEERCSSNA
jgi:hypothetical protein